MLGFSSLRLHTEGSVPATNGIIDAPLSLPQEQSWSSRSSYTVAIPHASLDLDVRKLRRAGWHYASPPPSREPRLARSSRTHTLSSVPPPRPKRSPLRSFATKVEHKTLRDKLKRHTRASSASNYPPTMHTSNTGARDKLTRHTRASSVSNYPPTLHTSNTEARDKLTHYTWASSVSNYPPTLHTLNTEADSLSLKEGSDAASRNTFGVSPHGFLFGRDPNADATEQREKGRGMATPATGRSSADSNESWSVSLAQYSPLCSSARSARSASLATDTSTERTSIPDDEKAYRTPPLVWTRREASV
ncbi:hypothetical protein F5148DRAFT_806618 [Russula earlei]|uniref:Uncharacterized protein n=1 Tax=Russula earlei TaxID=71964 RepID=A0ACC0UBT9_9AGAM|nr:hypothetical protein F5148DRAFT_806618 [Russula earlei]